MHRLSFLKCVHLHLMCRICDLDQFNPFKMSNRLAYDVYTETLC